MHCDYYMKQLKCGKELLQTYDINVLLFISYIMNGSYEKVYLLCLFVNDIRNSRTSRPNS